MTGSKSIAIAIAIGIIRAEHRALGAVINNIKAMLLEVQAERMNALPATVTSYADLTWKHLRAEENEPLPLAEAHLLASEWDACAQAFAHNADPMVGSTDSELFDALFHDILKRIPAPLGLGAS
jgi:hemerythrin-like domain-containing protein